MPNKKERKLINDHDELIKKAKMQRDARAAKLKSEAAKKNKKK